MGEKNSSAVQNGDHKIENRCVQTCNKTAATGFCPKENPNKQNYILSHIHESLIYFIFKFFQMTFK
jgi:hypothetical protein